MIKIGIVAVLAMERAKVAIGTVVIAGTVIVVAAVTVTVVAAGTGTVTVIVVGTVIVIVIVIGVGVVLGVMANLGAVAVSATDLVLTLRANMIKPSPLTSSAIIVRGAGTWPLSAPPRGP